MNQEKSISIDDMRKRNKIREETNKYNEEITKNINKVKNSSSTFQIAYPEYKESFDYVDKIFPDREVKKVTIFKTSYKTMEKYGFGNAGGFYSKVHKIIVVSSSKRNNRIGRKYSFSAKLERDEVIVHELIHYCFYKKGCTINSRELSEEFAYGWSIGYLRGKGYSDEKIIKNNFMPFLVSCVKEKAIRKVFDINNISIRDYNKKTNRGKGSILRRNGLHINQEIEKMSNELGGKIIKLYNSKMNDKSGINNIKIQKNNRVNILDI